ncbi:MAG TPA: alpha/beta hydrolase [Spongiibacteraceae bacterium]|jgi:esterase/lipase superfamily enzyme
MPDLIMSVRALMNDQFIADVGPTTFLNVPDGAMPLPAHAIPAAQWYQSILQAAAWKNSNGEQRGDILFIIHGYNMSEKEVIARHRRLKKDLINEGFLGVVVSFDWPSDDKALAYLPDRHRAKLTAMQLVSDGIRKLSELQTPSCKINIHVIGHSTGVYVIREAFDDADDTQLPNSSWGISQIIFAAGDVSSASMSVGDSGAESVYLHSVRLTNYFSRHDEALDLSNVKRIGNAPRVGRIGLPADAPSKAVNVDCTAYYEKLTTPGTLEANLDQVNGFVGMQSHSWYFGNRMFTLDLLSVLIGTDRMVIPTRSVSADGKFLLQHIDKPVPPPKAP